MNRSYSSTTRRQRGLALITVLLLMSTVTMVGLAAQQLVEANIGIAGAQYQNRIARSAASSVMTVFRTLGRPRLAALVPTGFNTTRNIDLTGHDFLPEVQNSLRIASESSAGLIENNAYSYNASERGFISVDYLGRAQVPPGNEAAELFPSTINNGQFCADYFRLVSEIATTSGARGAIDQNMYIVSQCL